MNERINPAVHIGQLNLRVPGRSAETGHRVASGIAESLARKVPAGLRRQLGALNVRVQLNADASEAEISEAISAAIVRALPGAGEAASTR